MGSFLPNNASGSNRATLNPSGFESLSEPPIEPGVSESTASSLFTSTLDISHSDNDRPSNSVSTAATNSGDDSIDLSPFQEAFGDLDVGSLLDLQAQSANEEEDLAYSTGCPGIALDSDFETNSSPLSDVELPSEDLGVPKNICIEELKIANAFISDLQDATLDSLDLYPAVLERLRNPPQEPLSLDDHVLRLSIDIYLGLDNASENHYELVRKAVARCPPHTEMLSLSQVKRKVQEISGIYPVFHDMCINSCVAFVGPYADHDSCPACHQPRYEPVQGKKKTLKARQQFLTNPIGPQIQAAWRSPESAAGMSYRRLCTEHILEDYLTHDGVMPEISDWIHGTEYIEAVQDGRIDEHSTTLLLSLDGAQLYRSKQSDCWMYIWVLLDRAPDSRYKKKHVLIGGVIPGPSKPKNIDSFLFPGFRHLSALMKEGLVIWDANTASNFISKLFLAFVTADGPGMQYVNGLVGHSGRHGCRLYCPIRGRHKAGSGHYYPAMLKPSGDYNVEGSLHNDISLRNLPDRPQDVAMERYRTNLNHVECSQSAKQYRERRLETGVAKPSIISGLPRDSTFGVPNACPGDIMHLAALNLPELLIALQRGTLPCEAPDDKSTWEWAIFRDNEAWKSHGMAVAAATPYLPGSFDRPPRNPAEKISSGYKAVEFLTYIYGLCPTLWYGVLPFKYWRNLCKLIRGIRLVYQRRITPEQLREAHKHLIEFAEEYEHLYYGRNVTRIHFCRQSIHAPTHISPETFRIGPYGIVGQFPMERAIGDLGGEIRQPSRPYANLSQRALRRCQTNALKHMFPDLDPEPPRLPRGAIDLGANYILLRAAEELPRAVTPKEAEALQLFIDKRNIEVTQEWYNSPRIARWARVRLPTGQIARSLWKESLKPMDRVRISRNVKVNWSKLL